MPESILLASGAVVAAAAAVVTADEAAVLASTVSCKMVGSGMSAWLGRCRLSSHAFGDDPRWTLLLVCGRRRREDGDDGDDDEVDGTGDTDMDARRRALWWRLLCGEVDTEPLRVEVDLECGMELRPVPALSRMVRCC